MIIGSNEQLEIGKIYGTTPTEFVTTLNSDGSIKRNFNKPFMVLSEATLEEWYNQHIESYGEPPKSGLARKNEKFYKISVD